MKTVAIIQARMGSTRLPGKVLMEAAGKPLLQHMVERLQRCEKLDEIVVATPGEGDQEPIWKICTDIGCQFQAACEENDVLSRVLHVAQYQKADTIVELTGDCPLIDPAIVDDAVKAFESGQEVRPKLAFVSTSRPSLNLFNVKHAYPPGMDVRVFSRKNLEYISTMTHDPVDREHVSIYFWEHQRQFWCHDLLAPPMERSDVRLTVDTPEDLDLVRKVFENFAPHNDFDLEAILSFLHANPELREINAQVEQKPVR